MFSIRIRKGWEIPEREATPEAVYQDRRSFLKAMGFTGLGAFGLLAGCLETKGKKEVTQKEKLRPIEATRNTAFTLDRPITEESVAARYNNFYEFTDRKERVWKMVGRFQTRPWEIEVAGLVDKPKIYDVDDLMRLMPMEERLYRFRCVEAWAMAVPWIGFPFKALIDMVQPFSSARYVRMLTFLKPDQAPGQENQRWYPWPYFESLTMAEATNELTILVTGIYGHELPKQHGAPIRLIVPWKYGFKSIKSIALIEFTDRRPPTFWNTLAPREYDFVANVNPKVPHPRWSQASERMIDTGERLPTLLYNGYAEYVSHLYEA